MSGEYKNVFKSEYKTEYLEQPIKRTPIFSPHDCFAGGVHQDKQIEPARAALWTLNDAESNQLIKKLFLERQKSVYKTSYKNPTESRLRDSDERQTKENKYDSELLRYLDDLYFNPHNEKVLSPPPTFRRVFGYASPQLVHRILSTYQDTVGRAGASVMFDNAEFMEKLKQQVKKELKQRKKRNNFNECK